MMIFYIVKFKALLDNNEETEQIHLVIANTEIDAIAKTKEEVSEFLEFISSERLG